MRVDILQQIADYRGVLTFPAVGGHPVTSIPLYIKDHPVPVRRRKPTEVNTIPTIDPMSGRDISTSVLFFGVPDPLQLVLSGWIITPVSGGQWVPTADGSLGGGSLNVGNISYAEVISAYLEGRMNPSANGVPQRTDPSTYTSPHGNVYPYPTIVSWDPQYSQIMKKQPFSMTLLLEK